MGILALPYRIPCMLLPSVFPGTGWNGQKDIHCRTRVVHFELLLYARRIRHGAWLQDRKSTRLNSSHVSISYAVFCLKKKKTVAERTGEVHGRGRCAN